MLTTDSLYVQRRNVTTRRVTPPLKSQRIHMHTGSTKGAHHQRPSCKCGCLHVTSVHVFYVCHSKSWLADEHEHKVACAEIHTSKLQRGISGAILYKVRFISQSKHACQSQDAAAEYAQPHTCTAVDHMSCPLQR